MDEAIAKKLREPFPDAKIGKLPKLTCWDCRNAKNKQCDNHRKEQCPTCGNWLSVAHIHIDYVGHADITDRFLEVDPGWDWEPVAREVDKDLLRAAIETGNADIVKQIMDAAPPKLDSNGGMWMRVTIAGTTRLGYGDGGGKRGSDAVKVAIGDGLRNAGMRFGAGLDMWRKEIEAGDAPAAQPPSQQRTSLRWLESIKARIAKATSTEELRTLGNELEAKVQGGFCEQAHYDEVWQLGTARLQELEQAEAERPTPPEAPRPVTAADEFAARIEATDTLEGLTDLNSEVMAAFKAQRFDPTDGNRLLRAIKNKQHDVGTRPA